MTYRPRQIQAASTTLQLDGRREFTTRTQRLLISTAEIHSDDADMMVAWPAEDDEVLSTKQTWSDDI